jgi:hypothetical protein
VRTSLTGGGTKRTEAAVQSPLIKGEEAGQPQTQEGELHPKQPPPTTPRMAMAAPR